MKNFKKILMVASILGIATLSGCAYNPDARLYTNSPEFKAWKRSLQADDYEYERSESASYHIINGKGVLRVGNRVYVR